MKGEWCYTPGYLSRKLCAIIIDKCKKRELTNARIGPVGFDDTQTRRSKVCFISVDDPDFEMLFEMFWKDINIVNNQWFNFDIDRITAFQFAEYDSSYEGTFQKHMDVFWLNNDPIYHRKLSMIIQLSDENSYEGGEFEFFGVSQYPNKTEIRKQGTAIYFPSFIEHKMNTVTKGTRYSLAVWVDGPKWR